MEFGDDSCFNDFNDSRNKAFRLRRSLIEHLDKNLYDLEKQITPKGIPLDWAQNEEQLAESVIKMLPQQKFNKVCIDCLDLKYQFQTKNDTLHIVGFDDLKEREDADTLVVQADFAVIEDGSFIFLNRHSSRFFNLFKHIIVVVNIDQLIMKCEDISFFLHLKSGFNKITDLKILRIPFKNIAKDEFLTTGTLGYTKNETTIKVLLYAGNVLPYMQDVFLRQSLYCIHCGRCTQVCPMHGINNDVKPIGIVKQNCLPSFNRSQAIFKQTTLCGNCQSVCPVQIPITDMLIYEMRLVNEQKNTSSNRVVHNILKNRHNMNKHAKPLFRFFLLKFMFGKNKMMHKYFSKIKGPFFNIVKSAPTEYDE